MGAIENNNNSMNELVFEGRNKAYGAYLIRRSYDDSLLKSFGIGMGVLICLILFYRFIPAQKESVPLPEPTKTTVVTLIKEEKKEIPKPVHHQNPPNTPRRNDALLPTFVDSTPPQKTEPVKTEEPPGPNPTGDSTGTQGTDHGTDLTEERGGAGRPEPAIIKDWVPEMPQFPGGEEALLRYLRDHIRFTENAVDAAGPSL